jgi:hypothetical protein
LLILIVRDWAGLASILLLATGVAMSRASNFSRCLMLEKLRDSDLKSSYLSSGSMAGKCSQVTGGSVFTVSGGFCCSFFLPEVEPGRLRTLLFDFLLLGPGLARAGRSSMSKIDSTATLDSKIGKNGGSMDNFTGGEAVADNFSPTGSAAWK